MLFNGKAKRQTKHLCVKSTSAAEERLEKEEKNYINKCDQDHVKVYSLGCFLTATKRPSNQTELDRMEKKNIRKKTSTEKRITSCV